MSEDIQLAFDTQQPLECDSLSCTEKAHGRVETRSYCILSAESLEQKSDWAGLQHIGKVKSEVFRDGKETQETRYFLLTFGDVNLFANVVRGHWGIENSLHWVLDVTFGEDACRVRKDHAPENFSTVRKLALNLLRQVEGTKLSIPRKQARAARKPLFLQEVLNCKKI